MATVATWLLRIYPKAWRMRYEGEMSAVLDNHGVSWRTYIDLFVGAAKAHLFWKRKGLWRVQFMFGSAILSALCLFVYTGLQQYMRHSANFPQQTIAQEMVTTLESGANVREQALPVLVNLKSSLSPFVIIYNNQGVVVESNVILNGHTPTLPQGVLDYTRTHGVDKLTWQPSPDARIATVVEHYGGKGGGFVLSGRSLQVVEDQETVLLHITELTWTVLLAGFSLFLFVMCRIRTA